MNEVVKPCLVDTGQGFSVLYHNRHLYSRHDPARTPRLAAERLVVKPETLIVCFSPLLGYGIRELLSNLPPDCMILGLEADPLLYALSRENLPSDVRDHPRFSLLHSSSIGSLLTWFDANHRIPVRRCISLDCSGGAVLNAGFYRSAIAALDSFIATWWKNRMTLMILGRNFNRNVLRNLSLLSGSTPLEAYANSKPVFVAGAGPSLDSSLSFLAGIRNRVFLLAVDTALAPLVDSGIRPDAVVVLESQFWIEQAFYGLANSDIPVFADLVSRPQALKITGGPVSFFSSSFAESPLLDRLKDAGLLPLPVPALGSVGLVALHIARYLAGENAPVFFTGLDFSQGTGYSHSRGSPWPEQARRTVSRLLPPGPPLFSAGSFFVNGKQNRRFMTNPVLSGYARLCRERFGSDDRCFDIGQEGIDTGCRRLSREEAETLLNDIPDPCRDTGRCGGSTDEPALSPAERESSIRAFLQDEYRRLTQLRDILSGKHSADKGLLSQLVEDCAYLYTHFPDAHCAKKTDQSFLNRIRIEADVFLKTMATQSGMSMDRS